MDVKPPAGNALALELVTLEPVTLEPVTLGPATLEPVNLATPEDEAPWEVSNESSANPKFAIKVIACGVGFGLPKGRTATRSVKTLRYSCSPSSKFPAQEPVDHRLAPFPRTWSFTA